MSHVSYKQTRTGLSSGLLAERRPISSSHPKPSQSLLRRNLGNLKVLPCHCVWRLIVFLSLLGLALGFTPLKLVLCSTATEDGLSRSVDEAPPLLPTHVGQTRKSPSKCSWTDRVRQLIEYREQNGNTLVPKRYVENPSLGNWVNKQRQQYRKFCANETPCSLTEARVQVLNDVGFCWDANTQTATSISSGMNRDSKWYQRLSDFQEHLSSQKELSSSLSSWLRQQRREYWCYQAGESSKLDAKQIDALTGVDPNWWKSSQQIRWETRLAELIEYRNMNGDCCVPINHENKKLANWVSNLRKRYRLKMAGQGSNISSKQIEELNKIGFVWDRWDYEYEKKLRKFSVMK